MLLYLEGLGVKPAGNLPHKLFNGALFKFPKVTVKNVKNNICLSNISASKRTVKSLGKTYAIVLIFVIVYINSKALGWIYLGLPAPYLTRCFAVAPEVMVVSTKMMCLFPNLCLFSIYTEGYLFPLNMRFLSSNWYKV